MHHLFRSLIVALLLTSHVSFAADNSKSPYDDFTISADNWRSILTYLEFPDLVALGHCSTGMRFIVLDLVGPRDVDATFTAKDAAQHQLRFRLYAALTAEPYPLKSLTLKCETNEALNKVKADAFFMRCPFAAKEFKFEAGRASPSFSTLCTLSEDLDDLLTKQPCLEKIVINSTFSETLKPSCFSCFGNQKALKECTITGPSINAECLGNMSTCDSLCVLIIDDLVCDNAISLPKQLSVLKVEGCNLSSDLFTCIGNLQNVTSLHAQSRYRSGEEHMCHNISSPLCKIITDDLKTLYIDGLFIVDQDSVCKIASSTCGEIFMHKYTDTRFDAETIRISMKPETHETRNKFQASFPSNDLTSTLSAARAIITKGRQVLIQIQSESFHVSDYHGYAMAPLTIQTTLDNQHLATVLAQLTDEEFVLQYNANGLLNDDNFPFKILQKNWNTIVFDGNFSLAVNALTCLKVNAPHIDFELSVDGPTRSILVLRKIPRDQVTAQSGVASLHTHHKSSPIAKSSVFALAAVSKITQISISGGHELTPADVKLLVTQFGFDEIHVGHHVIRLEGSAAILEYLEKALQLPESMQLMRNKNWK